MLRTLAGYAGGKERSPSYIDMKDHSETVLVEYDPRVISYRQLLDVFWRSHDPTYDVRRLQYRNAIFYRTEEQRSLAEQTRLKVAESRGREIYTAVKEAGEFYPAEDYHQKYYLRGADELFAEFRRIYPRAERLVMSTAAARLNGYLGCNGGKEDLQDDLDKLGLSAAGQSKLVDHVTSACARFEGLVCPAP